MSREDKHTVPPRWRTAPAWFRATARLAALAVSIAADVCAIALLLCVVPFGAISHATGAWAKSLERVLPTEAQS